MPFVDTLMAFGQKRALRGVGEAFAQPFIVPDLIPNEVPDAPAPTERTTRGIDDAGFRSLFRGEFGYVWNTLRRLGVAARDADDVAHDVFVAVHRQRSTYDPGRPVRPWLFAFAFQTASDHRRRAWQRRAVMGDGAPEVADDAPGPDERLDAARDRALVLAALDAIELDHRAVLVMHDLDGHSVPEIAAAQAIPLNTAYSRLRLARQGFAAAVARLRARRGER